MVENTRLKQADRAATIMALHTVLNRVTQFIEMPVQDNAPFVNAWNSKFPPELFDAMDVCKQYGYDPGTRVAETLRFVAEYQGKFYTAPIRWVGLPGKESARRPIRLTEQLRHKLCWEVRTLPRGGNSTVYWAMVLNHCDLHEHLGADNTELFYDWLVSTAQLKVELEEAHQTIKDIFEMAKTAGQIKRMVPDLLQYLPIAMRKAYESQIRASSLPFEWAPYPKCRAERMITALNKGHLLSGLAKAGQENWCADNLDDYMWGQEVTLKATVPEVDELMGSEGQDE